MNMYSLLAKALTPGVVPQNDGGAQAAASDHFVQVTVDNGVITVDRDTLPVNGKNATIFWVLQTNGCTFPENAIVFKTATGGQFFDGQVQANGRKFHLKDKNTVIGDFAYTILVKQGATVLQLDPMIKNQG